MFPLSQLGGRRRLSPGWEEERSPGRLVEVKNADEISKSPSLGLRLASILSISRGVPEMGRGGLILFRQRAKVPAQSPRMRHMSMVELPYLLARRNAGSGGQQELCRPL
jgi:hypothetical protein